MDQTHIGYTFWNQPSRNVMPEVKEINVPAEPNMGVAIEGTQGAQGVKIDSNESGFIEADGYVSIEAEHYTKKVDAGDVRWEKIEDYGRTLSSMTIFPVTAKSVTPPTNSPCLEYKIYLFGTGPVRLAEGGRDLANGRVEVEAIFAPTLNFVPGRGLRYAVSFDDQPAKIIDILPAGFDARNGNAEWEQSVRDSVRKIKSSHTISQAGYHTLKIWMVDPGVVLQKIVVDTGGVKPSYLGPPESFRGGKGISDL
jgi:hypothetical protein